MLFPLLGLVYFLTFSPQAVLSIFQLVSYSPIQQCGPFRVSFAGGTPPTIPLTLTVLPFNSTALAFAIPQSAWNNSTASGSYVAFLPLPEGVSLMASLDDSLGNSAALTSGVIQISSSDNTSCISTAAGATGPSTFQLLNTTTTISQCSPFSVSHYSYSPDHPISIKVLIPTGLSFWLRRTSFHSGQGADTFTFIMSVARGFQVALLFDDGQGNRQVSDLLSVTGGESTPTSCLQIASTSTAASAESLSRSAVIAISATSSVVVVVIVILGVFFVRRERRKLAALRRNPIDTTQNQFGERGLTVSSPVPPGPSGMPPYVHIARVSSNPMDIPVSPSRSSIFSPFIPSSLGIRKSQSNISRNASVRTKSTIGGPNSRPLVDLDIVGLLEIASVTHQESEIETQSTSSVIPTSTPAVPPPSMASPLKANRLSSARRRSHRDLDVPLSPLRTFSGVSNIRGAPVLAQETRVTNHDLSGQASSIPSRDAGVRSRSNTPVRF